MMMRWLYIMTGRHESALSLFLLSTIPRTYGSREYISKKLKKHGRTRRISLSRTIRNGLDVLPSKTVHTKLRRPPLSSSTLLIHEARLLDKRALTRTHTRTHASTHAHTRTHACTLARTHIRTHARSLARTHAHTHARTNTHTHART